jgi:hypothetical protein
MKLVVFQVSVCVQSDLTYGRIFLRWLKEVQNFPLLDLHLTLVCHVCRCEKLYMGKIYTLITIRAFNILN